MATKWILFCAIKAQKQMYQIAEKCQVTSSLVTGKLMGNETLYQTLTYAMLLGLSVNTFYSINH